MEDPDDMDLKDLGLVSVGGDADTQPGLTGSVDSNQTHSEERKASH